MANLVETKRPTAGHANNTSPDAGDQTPSGTPQPESPAESSRAPRKRALDDYAESDLLEVNVSALAPLSRAEARLVKKRSKRSQNDGKGGDEAEKFARRKEKRLEKDRQRGAKPAPSDGPLDDASLEHEVEDKAGQSKHQNSIWIGNLAYKTTSDSLKRFVERGVTELGGADKSVTRVKLPKQPGKGQFGGNKGYALLTEVRADERRFAYVDLATPELQSLALTLSERMVDGRKVLIKLGKALLSVSVRAAQVAGDDHEANPNALIPKGIKPSVAKKGKPNHPETATLFVGNLPFDATEEGIRDLVEANAEASSTADEPDAQVDQNTRGGKKSGLRKVRLGAFEDTGRCKGSVNFVICQRPAC